MSTQIAVLQWVIYDTFYQIGEYDYNEFEDNDVYHSILIWYGCDTTINTICILLQFKFMDNVYNKICNKCHQYMYLRCSNFAKKQMYQEMNAEIAEGSLIQYSKTKSTCSSKPI
eukprot:415765_1